MGSFGMFEILDGWLVAITGGLWGAVVRPRPAVMFGGLT